MTETAMALIDRPAWTPSKLDYCDACGTEVSLAYTRVTRDNKELFFCNHHTRSYAAEMIANGWSVEDHSEILNETVSK